MSKLVQFKNRDENVYTSSILKQVNGLNIKTGQTYTDTLIKKAKQIVIYYSIHALKYKRNFTISRGDAEWFWDTNESWIIYVMIDWDKGKIIMSGYTTVNDNVCIMGYDLIL